MLSKLMNVSLWKMGVYLIYLFSQILILAALMLTTTNMIVHIVAMCLTILFYFMVSFTDPGVYTANPQPNHEDAESRTKNKEEYKRNVRGFHSENDCKPQEVERNNRDQPQKDVPNSEGEEVIKDLRNKKKTSLEERNQIVQAVEGNYKLQINGIEEPSQKKEATKSNGILPVSASNIFQVAKAAIGNLTNMMSRKQIQAPLEEEKSKKANINVSCQKQVDKLGGKQQLSLSVNVSLSDNTKKNGSVSQTSEKEQPAESQYARQKEDFNFDNINRQFDHRIQRQSKSSKNDKNKPLSQRVAQIKRYCRICQIYQPLRVRHCHSCQQCISTFDHHCPWLNNCIGQKNKHIFLIYLLVQNLQFFIIMVDLMRYLASTHEDNGAPVGILLLSVILFFGLIGVLLIFHMYLIGNNLTTWEMFRWDRIEYLNIFEKSKLTSPFSKGFKHNFKIFWQVCRRKDRKQWEQEIGDDLEGYLLKKTKKPKTELKYDGPDTDRKLFRSHQNL